MERLLMVFHKRGDNNMAGKGKKKKNKSKARRKRLKKAKRKGSKK